MKRNLIDWEGTWIVFRADLINTLRDRRTWLAMIIVPLLMVPVLLIAMPTAMEGQMRRLEATPPEVAVVGSDEAPDLIAFLERSPEFRIVSHADPAAGLAAGEIRAVLRVQEGAAARIAGGQTAGVVIEYDASHQLSELTRARIESVLAIYSQLVVADRLETMGVDAAVLVPIQTEIRNVAPEEKVGGFYLAMIMPMLLAVWAALGGMYAAIDAVAGEKERGTLEPLLATPPAREVIVAGKYLTVVLTAVIASMIALLGMYIAFLIRPEALTTSSGFRFSLPAVNVFVALGIIVLLAGIFSALQLALSAFARSFREAQSYLSPISIAVVIPGILTQFSHPAEVAWWTYLIPLVNAMYVFKQVLMDVLNWRDVVTTFVASILFVVMALRFAVSVCKKETVLFRT